MLQDQDHKRLGIDLFNATWDLIDKADRSDDDNAVMVQKAHASAWHWSHVGQPVNVARGDWQVSHVYAILGWAEPATFFARRCLETCERHGIGDFDIAFAYEALARAAAAAGDTKAREERLAKARELGERIADQGDRDEFFRQLGTVP